MQFPLKCPVCQILYSVLDNIKPSIFLTTVGYNKDIVHMPTVLIDFLSLKLVIIGITVVDNQ